MRIARTNKDQVTIFDSANIALKGIIGVKAMAEIAHAVGEDLDATHYSVSHGESWVCVLSEVMD